MRRTETATLVELPHLPCPYCGASSDPETQWAASAATVWGCCGVKLVEGGTAYGLVLLAPTEEPGQALIKRAWVSPERTGRGHGRQLIQTVAACLVAQKAREIVAIGSREHLRCEAPPRDFLKAVGFVRSLEDHLWHLDLDRTATGRPGSLIERFLSSLRPVTTPNPAGGAIGRTGCS